MFPVFAELLCLLILLLPLCVCVPFGLSSWSEEGISSISLIPCSRPFFCALVAIPISFSYPRSWVSFSIPSIKPSTISPFFYVFRAFLYRSSYLLSSFRITLWNIFLRFSAFILHDSKVSSIAERAVSSRDDALSLALRRISIISGSRAATWRNNSGCPFVSPAALYIFLATSMINIKLPMRPMTKPASAPDMMSR
jgi:hypothetical protein